MAAISSNVAKVLLLPHTMSKILFLAVSNIWIQTLIHAAPSGLSETQTVRILPMLSRCFMYLFGLLHRGQLMHSDSRPSSRNETILCDSENNMVCRRGGTTDEALYSLHSLSFCLFPRVKQTQNPALYLFLALALEMGMRPIYTSKIDNFMRPN